MVDPELIKLMRSLPGLIAKDMSESAHFVTKACWDSVLSNLTQYWIQLAFILFVLFIILFIKAKLGRWGSLGSYLYNVFYFGTLFILGLIFGPGFFTSDYFKPLCAVILYPLCYWLVGRILIKLGVH
jgi:lipopolysaccharide export LptBFGC system permease protein LptF